MVVPEAVVSRLVTVALRDALPEASVGALTALLGLLFDLLESTELFPSRSREAVYNTQY